jgi:hypothetical protein
MASVAAFAVVQSRSFQSRSFTTHSLRSFQDIFTVRCDD